MRNIALILAAGSSIRMNDDMPKQYLKLGNKYILQHTVQKFITHPQIDKVCIVINPTHKKLFSQTIEACVDHDKCILVSGGATRQESVRKGLEYFRTAPKNILIHDAARPFVSHQLITRVLEALQETDAVDVSLPLVDTIKYYNNARTVDRSQLYRTQTPQGFRFATIYKLHQRFRDNDFTDDIGLCIKADIPISKVPGSAQNIKITYSEDLKIAERMINYKVKIGSGFDVHKFAPGIVANHTIPLCGVHVEHDRRIISHSDGDVALHALVDAMLGVISAGDIGTHFPPSDSKWKGCKSGTFVKYALQLLKQQNTMINNVDITIICQKPKVMPYIDLMKNKLAKLLMTDMHDINIKATTTEYLGFLGRKEGIAAQAICCATSYEDDNVRSTQQV